MATEKENPALVNPFVGQPFGWIQWKGTNVCMDVHCQCGSLLHIDADFAYYIQRGHCKQWYACNGHIRLEPVAREDITAASGAMHVLEGDEEDEY